MSVHDITLSDPTGNVSPPEQVLHLCAVDDLAFLAVEKYDEDAETRTFTRVAEIAVSLPALREAVELLTHERDREDLREKDKNGQRGARIGGNRLVVTPL